MQDGNRAIRMTDDRKLLLCIPVSRRVLAKQMQLRATSRESSTARRFKRLFALLNHMSSGRTFTNVSLAEILDVSQRTIHRDMSLLRAAGLPFSVPDSHGSKLLQPFVYGTLAPEAALLLMAVIDSLSRLPSLGESLSTCTRMISNQIPPEAKIVMGRVRVRFTDDISTQSEYLLAALNSLSARRKIRVVYTSQSSSFTTLIAPESIAYEEGQWTITGQSSYHRCVISIMISEIKAITLTSDRFSLDANHADRRKKVMRFR